METLEKPVHKLIDALQVTVGEQVQVLCPVKHLFTPKMYIREVVMPADTVAVSKIHNSCHPFVVSKGRYAVYNSENNETVLIEAPFTGMTKPGARRVFHVLEETILTTFHPMDFITGEENEWTDEQKDAIAQRIEDMIIDKREITA